MVKNAGRNRSGLNQEGEAEASPGFKGVNENG